MIKYIVIDRQTGFKVGGPYTTKQRARSAVDRKDNAYGGYKHFVQELDEETGTRRNVF